MRRLRERLPNNFDAIVVAGDIGSDLDTAAQVFGILSSFECPILYVYGNWDHSLHYDHSFGVNAYHLHDTHFTLDGWTFVGFSGVAENWGCNPLAASITRDLDAQYEAGCAEIDGRIAALEQLEREMMIQCEALPPLPNKAHLRPAWLLRRRLSTLRGKRKQLEAVLMARYYHDYKKIGQANRRELLMRMTGHSPERTIVITHARLTKTAEDMPDVPLFLFGHTHGFADTRIGRSRFINVSALDHVVTVMPQDTAEKHWRHMRSADVGAYTIIEIGQEIVATSHRMRLMPEGWKQVSGSGFKLKPLNQDNAASAPEE